MLTEARGDALSYAPVGITAAAAAPDGYRRDEWSATVGRGPQDFARAASGLFDWQVQRGSGLVVLADGPVALDVMVAMAAPLPLHAGYVDVVCRVVTVVDTVGRRGFAYGTLPEHPEHGEESFTVVLAEDGSVQFEIVAVSRPRHLLARAFPPVARSLQRAATERYIDAMRALVATHA